MEIGLEKRLKINSYSQHVVRWRKEKGFITGWPNMLEKLMLVVTEVGEAAEAYRHNNRKGFNEEIADTYIRLMDITGTLDIDIEMEIHRKMMENTLRPVQHGKVMGDVAERVE